MRSEKLFHLHTFQTQRFRLHDSHRAIGASELNEVALIARRQVEELAVLPAELAVEVVGLVPLDMCAQ